MSDLDTETRLARLKECYPNNEVLAEDLNCAERTISGYDELSNHTGLCTKIDRLHEQIQQEHTAGLDAVSYALQTIERLRNGNLTDEQLDNVESVLQKKAEMCNA